MKMKNEVLDKLALDYAAGNEGSIEQLFEELHKFIKIQAYKAVERAASTNVHIPESDFESVFTQAIWEAAKGFDGSSRFIQRLHFIMDRREADVWRSYRTSVAGEVTYEKGRNASLDAPVGEGQTLGDLVLAKHSTPSPEDEYVGASTLMGHIEAFGEENAKYHLIIELLTKEATNDEIAAALGEEKYNGKIRAVVCRARAAFERYLGEVEYSTN